MILVVSLIKDQPAADSTKEILKVGIVGIMLNMKKKRPIKV